MLRPAGIGVADAEQGSVRNGLGHQEQDCAARHRGILHRRSVRSVDVRRKSIGTAAGRRTAPGTAGRGQGGCPVESERILIIKTGQRHGERPRIGVEPHVPDGKNDSGKGVGESERSASGSSLADDRIDLVQGRCYQKVLLAARRIRNRIGEGGESCSEGNACHIVGNTGKKGHPTAGDRPILHGGRNAPVIGPVAGYRENGIGKPLSSVLRDSARPEISGMVIGRHSKGTDV